MAGLDPFKTLSRDTNNRERNAIHVKRLSQHVRIRAKSGRPVVVAQHGKRRVVRLVLRGETVTALRTRLLRPSPRALDPHHDTVVLIRVLLGFEAVLYSVIPPLLPHYAHVLGASKPAIGVLAAAYPAGMVRPSPASR